MHNQNKLFQGEWVQWEDIFGNKTLENMRAKYVDTNIHTTPKTFPNDIYNFICN